LDGHEDSIWSEEHLSSKGTLRRFNKTTWQNFDRFICKYKYSDGTADPDYDVWF
jgi:hypothetical protein